MKSEILIEVTISYFFFFEFDDINGILWNVQMSF